MCFIRVSLGGQFFLSGMSSFHKRQIVVMQNLPRRYDVVRAENSGKLSSGWGPALNHAEGASPNLLAGGRGSLWNRISGSRVTGPLGQRFWSGRVGSRVSVPDPVFD